MSIYLEEEICSLSDIYKKNIKQLSFKDVISLVFHACQKMIGANEMWQNYYHEFTEELALQNKYKCPDLTTISNNYNKRIEVFCNKGFITSNNLLTLLLRLIYIENRKKSIYYTNNYFKVLDYTLYMNKYENIEKLSIHDVFSILKPYMEYYIRIYSDEFMFEYQLALSIINQL